MQNTSKRQLKFPGSRFLFIAFWLHHCHSRHRKPSFGKFRQDWRFPIRAPPLWVTLNFKLCYRNLKFFFWACIILISHKLSEAHIKYEKFEPTLLKIQVEWRSASKRKFECRNTRWRSDILKLWYSGFYKPSSATTRWFYAIWRRSRISTRQNSYSIPRYPFCWAPSRRIEARRQLWIE